MAPEKKTRTGGDRRIGKPVRSPARIHGVIAHYLGVAIVSG